MARNKARFLEAFETNLGNVTLTCRILNIAKTQVYEWRKRDEAFAAAMDAVDESTIDFVENKLMKRINAEDTTAIIFFLKTKGKKRGYIEKQQVEAVGRPQIQVQVSDAETAKKLNDILDNADNKDV